MNTDVTTLIGRFVSVYGSPNTPDPEGFIAEFEKAVGGYRGDFLAKAGDAIIRKNVFWPKPAEVLEAIHSIVERTRESYVAELDQREKDWKKPTEEELARTRELMARLRLDLSRNAMEDGDPSDYAANAQRPGFEKMQRESRNTHLHTLTDKSKAMSGDRE